VFRSKRWQRLEAGMAKMGERLDQLERHHDQVRTILMVQNPDSQVAADAYDGLRKQVISAVSTRFTHLTQLVQLDTALNQKPSPDVLAKLVEGWFEQAGLVRITDPLRDDADLLFETVDRQGDRPVVLAPAYLDGTTLRVIRRGRLRHVAAEPEPAFGSEAPGLAGEDA
jgi:hypothetical protein